MGFFILIASVFINLLLQSLHLVQLIRKSGALILHLLDKMSEGFILLHVTFCVSRSDIVM